MPSLLDSFDIAGGTLSGPGVNDGNTLTVGDTRAGAEAGKIDQTVSGSEVLVPARHGPAPTI